MPKNNIPLDYLRACFEVDFAAGTLTWRTRPPDHFSRVNNRWQAWNTEYSGQIAGAPNGNGYLIIHLTINGKTRKLYVHIIIWALAHGAWPPSKLDHWNGIRNDNRLSNLRLATSGENSHNMGQRLTHRASLASSRMDAGTSLKSPSTLATTISATTPTLETPSGSTLPPKRSCIPSRQRHVACRCRTSAP
jgi:HNH endonuclease